MVRPPVGPKTYKKVYAFLDSALTAGTPRKQQKNSIAPRSEPSTPSKQRIQAVNGTPSKTPARTPQAKTPASAKSSTKRKRDEVAGEDDLPSWVMPAIRSLCKTFKIAQAAPHVFVGVASIVRRIREQQAAASSSSAKKRSRKSAADQTLSSVISTFDDTQIPALMVVVSFFTRSHLLGAPESREYAVQRTNAIKAVSKALPVDVVADEDTTVPIIEDLLREAENGWLDMEWYHNLPEPAADTVEATEEISDSAEVAEEDEDRPVQALQVPKRGFGSMMTDATDYLSEDRQTEFKRWKTNILRRIAQAGKQDKGKAIKI